MENNPDTGRIALHEEVEIAKFRLRTDKDSVLLIYRNLAKSWWWEGLVIKAVIEADPQEPNRLNLHQAYDSPEYDQPNSLIKPYKLGYMEISNVVEGKSKPINICLGCSWQAVVSFWKELEIILCKEFPVIDTSSELDFLRKQMPTNKTRLAKWIYIANKIDRTKLQGNLDDLGVHIKRTYPRYPHSREVLGLIFRCKDAGLLKLPDSENLRQ